jgi:hypothetical protein
MYLQHRRSINAMAWQEMRRRTAPLSGNGVVLVPTITPLTEDVKDENQVENSKDQTIRRSETAITPSFLVAKWAILRFLGAVYFIAFLGAFHQNLGLLGEHGLQPASRFMKRLQEQGTGFFQHPTIFWWVDLTDTSMHVVAILGMILSTLVVVVELDSWVIMFALWLFDFSIVTVAGGTSFYSYGWESQLLETGFLAIFLCELPHLVREESSTGGSTATNKWSVRALWRDPSSAYAADSKPSIPLLWLFRWLCFRISIGAGLIKIRGSSCWASKTCLWYHFETQPIPSPTSFIFHFLPKSVLSRAVDLDLFVQLYTSWFVLVPGSVHSLFRFILRLGGFVQAAFMLNIILSGNFAFLNHLTIIPTLACLDDGCWPSFLARRLRTRSSSLSSTRRTISLPPRALVDAALVILITWLSSPVVTNLLQLGSQQVMNGSFDSFRLVNTYGAFGSVGEARFEPIISVRGITNEWVELDFPCKPGRVTRRPCFCAPYHFRLDWNIWFIGFPPHGNYLRQRETWVYALLEKILADGVDETTSRPWLALLDSTSVDMLERGYTQNASPRYAKVDMYQYQMAAPLWHLVADLIRGREVTWWKRTYKEPLIPPVQLDTRKRLVLAQDLE